jgi:hypothetical protein
MGSSAETMAARVDILVTRLSHANSGAIKRRHVDLAGEEFNLRDRAVVEAPTTGSPTGT